MYSVASSFPLDCQVDRAQQTKHTIWIFACHLDHHSETDLLFFCAPSCRDAVPVWHSSPTSTRKQDTGRFSTDFIEALRVDLEQYMNRIVQHPVARYAEVITSFLGYEDKLVSNAVKKAGYIVLEYKLNFDDGMAPSNSSLSVNACRRTILSIPPWLHPAFNIDVYDTVEVTEMFNRHIRLWGEAYKD